MPSTRTSDQLSSMAIGQWSPAGAPARGVRLVGAEQLLGQVVGRQDGLDLHVGVGEEADERAHLAGQRGAPRLDRPGEPHLHGQDDVVGAGVRVHVGDHASYEAVPADAASGAASAARYDRTPCPSSGNDAATHCSRCTGEPSRASDERTEAHAPTRRSCSSAPRSAKLPPRSDSAAVSVRAGAVVHHAHVLPAGAQQAHAAQRPDAPPAPRARPARAPAHDHRHHSSPVRPATGTVASAP